MKIVRCCALMVAMLAFAGCASRPQLADAPANATTSTKAILAFEAVCLKTAPSFAGAIDAAKPFGVNEFSDLGPSRMGMTKDSSLGVQIKLGVECAITTASQNDRTLSSQFGAAIARDSSERAPSQFPSVVAVRGQPFIFHHDRNGGEAFVMLKAGSGR